VTVLQICVGAPVLVPEVWPACAVVRGVAGERGWHVRILELGRIARDESDPRPTRGGDRREGDDVVLDDDVGLDFAEDLLESFVDVLRPVHERREGRLYKAAS